MLASLFFDVYLDSFFSHLRVLAIYKHRCYLVSCERIHLNTHIELEPYEQIYFDSYDPEALRFILDTQHKIIGYMKKKHYKNLYQIMILVDDFADDPQIYTIIKASAVSIYEG
ncbi:MAG: hypothetical protein ACKPKO_04030, partial [Candidatus Fonsibacter sp.]